MAHHKGEKHNILSLIKGISRTASSPSKPQNNSPFSETFIIDFMYIIYVVKHVANTYVVQHFHETLLMPKYY